MDRRKRINRILAAAFAAVILLLAAGALAAGGQSGPVTEANRAVYAPALPGTDGNGAEANADGAESGGIDIIIILLILIGAGALVLSVVAVIIFKRKKTEPGEAARQAPDAEEADLEQLRSAPQNEGLRLIGVAGAYSGMCCPVSDGLCIGRDPGRCSIVFPPETPGVSALHCEVRPADGGVIVTDLGSACGTLLENGFRLEPGQPCALKAGDAFYLGSKQNGFTIQ